MYIQILVVFTLVILIALSYRHENESYQNAETNVRVDLVGQWLQAKPTFDVLTPSALFYTDAVIKHIRSFDEAYDKSFTDDFDQFDVLVCHTRKVLKYTGEIKHRLPNDSNMLDLHARLTRRTVTNMIARMNDVVHRFKTSKWRVPQFIQRSAM